jgi:hypothetical protein
MSALVAQGRQVRRDPIVDPGLFGRNDAAIDGKGIGHGESTGVLGELDAAVVEAGKAVEEAGWRVERETGKPPCVEAMARITGRGMPEERLPQHDERDLREFRESCRPWPWAEHES